MSDLDDNRAVKGRVPPNDLDAEAAVLSAAILHPARFDEVADALHSEHFYSHANATTWEAIVDLRGQDRAVDLVTLRAWLADRDLLQRVGGVQYLANIIDASPDVSNVSEHAANIVSKWRVRQMIRESQLTAAEGYGPIEDSQAWIDSREQAIFAIASQRTGAQPELMRDVLVRKISELQAACESGCQSSVIHTGLEPLDHVLVGSSPGDLVIIAARPGMGKSSLLGQWALNAAALDKSAAAVFSLEMPREQWAQRILCSEADVNSRELIADPGKITPEEWSRLSAAAGVVGKLPLWIDDDSSPGLTAIRAKTRRLAAKANKLGKELRLVGVDYLQLMGVDRKLQSREQQVSANSRGLKCLAKDLGVVMVALSQMNRAVETRGKNAEPQLSDLRETGAIEQDADAVIFLHQPDKSRLVYSLIVAKNRNFGCGRCEIFFNKQRTRFEPYDGTADVSCPEAQRESW